MGSDGKKRLSVTLFMSNCLLTQVSIYTNWKIIVAIIKLAHSSKKGSVLWLSFFPMGRQAFNQCETRIIIKNS
jgi:hypothetical protein